MSYHTPQSTNSFFTPLDNKTKIFLIHFNFTSLQKNVDKLRLYLDNRAYKPDIVMESETKLKWDSLPIDRNSRVHYFSYDSTINPG